MVSIHERIRSDVLHGRWSPGEKLQTSELSKHYLASSTVVREALTRLAGERFVVVQPRRGFFVPTLSLDELRDLTEVRCQAESFAVELSVARGGLGWESELIACHHRLSRTPRRGRDDPRHVADAWATAHREFHVKLIEASNVPVLVGLARRLSDSTEIYRRWAAPSPDAELREVESEHSAILEAMLARDARQASKLLRAHYETTVDVVFRGRTVTALRAPPTMFAAPSRMGQS